MFIIKQMPPFPLVRPQRWLIKTGKYSDKLVIVGNNAIEFLSKAEAQ